MTEELENSVPDDEKIASEKPDAVVIIEEKKDEPKTATVIEQKDAATEGVEALARNLEKTTKEKEELLKRATIAEAGKAEAEAKISTAEVKLTTTEQQNIESNYTAAANDKTLSESNIVRFKKEAAELQAEGKFEEAEDARLKLYQAQDAYNKANQYLNAYFPQGLEAKIDAFKKEKIAAKAKEAPEGDGVYDPITKTRYTPHTYNYIKAQGDNWKDQDFRAACQAAAAAAKRKGIVVDTVEWDEFMDGKLVALGFKDEPQQTEEEVVTEETPKVTTKPAVKKPSAGASISAAPTRAVQGTNGVAKKGVKLTGAERDVAQSIVDSLPELFKGQNPDQLYAKSKMDDIAENGEDVYRIQQRN